MSGLTASELPIISSLRACETDLIVMQGFHQAWVQLLAAERVPQRTGRVAAGTEARLVRTVRGARAGEKLGGPVPS